MTVAGASAQSDAQPTFRAHGSVEQVYVTDAAAGEQLSLVDSAGSTVATKEVNSLGGLLFRNVTAGSGYRVRAPDGTQSDPLTVLTTQSAAEPLVRLPDALRRQTGRSRTVHRLTPPRR
jgi:hypothetical protein